MSNPQQRTTDATTGVVSETSPETRKDDAGGTSFRPSSSNYGTTGTRHDHIDSYGLLKSDLYVEEGLTSFRPPASVGGCSTRDGTRYPTNRATNRRDDPWGSKSLYANSEDTKGSSKGMTASLATYVEDRTVPPAGDGYQVVKVEHGTEEGSKGVGGALFWRAERFFKQEVGEPTVKKEREERSGGFSHSDALPWSAEGFVKREAGDGAESGRGGNLMLGVGVSQDGGSGRVVIKSEPNEDFWSSCSREEPEDHAEDGTLRGTDQWASSHISSFDRTWSFHGKFGTENTFGSTRSNMGKVVVDDARIKLELSEHPGLLLGGMNVPSANKDDLKGTRADTDATSIVASVRNTQGPTLQEQRLHSYSVTSLGSGVDSSTDICDLLETLQINCIKNGDPLTGGILRWFKMGVIFQLNRRSGLREGEVAEVTLLSDNHRVCYKAEGELEDITGHHKIGLKKMKPAVDLTFEVFGLYCHCRDPSYGLLSDRQKTSLVMLRNTETVKLLRQRFGIYWFHFGRIFAGAHRQWKRPIYSALGDALDGREEQQSTSA